MFTECFPSKFVLLTIGTGLKTWGGIAVFVGCCLCFGIFTTKLLEWKFWIDRIGLDLELLWILIDFKGTCFVLLTTFLDISFLLFGE